MSYHDPQQPADPGNEGFAGIGQLATIERRVQDLPVQRLAFEVEAPTDATQGMARGSVSWWWSDLTSPVPDAWVDQRLDGFGRLLNLEVGQGAPGTAAARISLQYGSRPGPGGKTLGDVLPVEMDVEVGGQAVGSMTMGYDGLGRVTGLSQGDTHTTLAYTPFGELDDLQTSHNGALLYQEDITAFDPSGRISAIEERWYEPHNHRTVLRQMSYQYDGLGQLIHAQYDDHHDNDANGQADRSQVWTWGYDANGNRLWASHSDSANPTQDWSLSFGAGDIVHDQQDRLLKYGQRRFVYSQRGSLLEEVDEGSGEVVVEYEYDTAGNLWKATKADGSCTRYIIDGHNRRVGQDFYANCDGGQATTSRRWSYQNQLEPVAEYDGQGNLVSLFVYGSRPHMPDFMVRVDEGNSVYRLVSNHLGSLRSVVDVSNGSVVQLVDHSPFGEPQLVDVANKGQDFVPFWFAGGLWDSHLAMTRFGARDYDPTIGRWTSKDPIGFGGGLNVFLYSINDPISLVDTSGEKPDPAGYGTMTEAAYAALKDAWIHSAYLNVEMGGWIYRKNIKGEERFTYTDHAAGELLQIVPDGFCWNGGGTLVDKNRLVGLYHTHPRDFKHPVWDGLSPEDVEVTTALAMAYGIKFTSYIGTSSGGVVSIQSYVGISQTFIKHPELKLPTMAYMRQDMDWLEVLSIEYANAQQGGVCECH